MKYSVIIPAAGIGARLNLGYNKMLLKHNNRTLLELTIEVFIHDNDCEEIIVVYGRDEDNIWKDVLLASKIKYTKGGDNREESVYNGLKLVSGDYVFVHDGARPNIESDLLDRIKLALNESDVVIPYITSNDAIFYKGSYLKREEIRLIQTPQAFKTTILREAFDFASKDNTLNLFKDEGSMVNEYVNTKINFVYGSCNNIKVTTKEDLEKIK